MSGWETSIEMMATLAEAFVFTSTAVYLSGRKYAGQKFWRSILIGAAMYAALVTFLNSFQLFSFATMGVAILFLIFYSHLVSTGNWLTNIAASIFTMLVMAVIDFVLFFLIGLLFESPVTDSRSFMLLMNPSFARTLYLVTAKAAQFLVFLCLSRWMPNLQRLHRRYVAIFAAICGISMIIISYLLSMILSESMLVMQTAIILSWIFIVACVAAVLVTCFIASNYQNEKETNRLLSTVNAITEENYQNLRTLQNEMAKQSHDFTHHMKLIHQLLSQKDSEAAERYTSSLLEASLNQAHLCQSGNNVIDAIINSKLREAKKLQVKLSYQVNFSLPTSISPIDICAILSNQIDNALEACREIEDCSRRRVNIKIYQQFGNAAIFLVSNTVAQNPFEHNKELKTTKTDKRRPHGLGLRSIRDTTEKYHGILENFYEDGRFISSVLLYYTPSVSTE